VIETRMNRRAYAAVLCPSVCQISLFSSGQPLHHIRH